MSEAIRFLTVFKFPFRPAEVMKLHDRALPRSMVFFPLVGFLIGILSFGLYLLFGSFFPPRIATFVLLIGPIVMSGGLHMDGFADFCDGFFGGNDKADVLRIMKDSSIGVWGALGMVLLVLVKFELLLALPSMIAFFLLAMTASRWAQVVLCFYLPYAGLGGGLSEQVAGKIGRREIFGATLFLIPFFFWLGKEGFFIMAGLVLFLFLLGIYFKKRIGGITGDLIGTISELTEVFVLLSATLTKI